ncbi:tripartite tricarboxylate transporter TctB family protein [Spiractinospora alimapuensis]|uniref:tripartite tricarboxylate transporter TctB family protein n=1 Tax=Spiractinospora alimapuensis TaxID=2820884 RepID=UPI001F299252|nr:tripartite tricarboxylate transporter TctB family protein [Spiractinospora alimapuensis]QVQ50053.1 tripartite tricarboxylate transporter TctB family protein [Spiractinospora alimapuensis]
MAAPTPVGTAPGRAGTIATVLVLLVVAGTVWAASLDLPAPGRQSDPGAGGYPRLLAVVLAALALTLLPRSVGEERFPRGSDAWRVVGVVAAIVGYVNVLAPLGYLLATTVFLGVALRLAGVRNVLALVGVSVAFSAAVYFTFYGVFDVSLPRGPLERLLT